MCMNKKFVSNFDTLSYSRSLHIHARRAYYKMEERKTV